MKKHFKLYKSGKLWVTAAVAVLSFAVSANFNQVSASDNTEVTSTQKTSTLLGNNDKSNDSNITTNINGYTNQNGTWKNTSGQSANGWQTSGNDWYHFNNGNQNKDWQNIDNNWYYMNPDNAKMETGIQKINNKTYYLNEQHDGTYGAMKTGWQYVDGHWYGFKDDGSAYLGWQNLGGNTYYFKPENAQMATGDTLISGNYYYFDPASGHQNKGFVLDGNGLLQYYDKSSGIRQTTVGSYSFNPLTGEIVISSLTDGLNRIANDTFYFDAKSGNFVANDWQKINGNWYHFDNNGVANTGWYRSAAGLWYLFNNDCSAKNGWYKSAAGLWYYFDPTNAWADTGWYWSGYNWYHFDENSAWADKGWYWSGYNWYYFDPTNAWADTGYHVINGAEYYFDPTDAYMYRNRWVNVGGWTYHADNSGRLWFPQWYSQFASPYAAEGCSVFATAIMLSPKEYINIPYALSLLQQRQAGNIYSGAGFSVVIQPNSLVDLARHFDGSVTNISGSSVQDIINTVNSGRPVLYYGYSRYENLYWNHNHCKVIVGYQNGWFRIYDCCYNYASQGSTGWNAYDYGAKGWITTSQFSREYAGQALTVN